MNDREKLIALINYVNGTCSGSEFVAGLNVKAWNEFVAKITADA